jgi:hypothetical protein
LLLELLTPPLKTISLMAGLRGRRGEGLLEATEPTAKSTTDGHTATATCRSGAFFCVTLHTPVCVSDRSRGLRNLLPIPNFSLRTHRLQKTEKVERRSEFGVYI